MGLFDYFKKKATTNETTNQQTVVTPKRIWNIDEPTFHDDLESFVFDMRSESGEKYSFVLSGHCLYSPNRCSTCGYGSDDWLYVCKLNNQNCLLSFTCNAEYAPIWDFVLIEENDVVDLLKGKASKWAEVFYSNMRKSKNASIHPVDITSAKMVIKSTASRMGVLTDKDLYGFSPER